MKLEEKTYEKSNGTGERNQPKKMTYAEFKDIVCCSGYVKNKKCDDKICKPLYQKYLNK